MKRRIRHAVLGCGNHICVGIDPSFSSVPEEIANYYRDNPMGLLEFAAYSLIDVAAERVGAVKFQSAYFEAFGSKGLQILERSIERARLAGLFVILDAKRGDIASTMSAYGEAAFEALGADALTVTAYMGTDVMKALLPNLRAGAGVYVVLESSNQSGRAIQAQELKGFEGRTVAQHLFVQIVQLAAKAGVEDAIGFVVGATQIDSLSSELLERYGQFPLLIPGIGAQGGEIKEKSKKKLDVNGLHLIPISRGISQVMPESSSTQATSITLRDRYQRALCARVEEYTAHWRVRSPESGKNTTY